jgi:hypothetical protein
MHQPWASAVALGHKRIETRSWGTKWRGKLVIHAGKRWTVEEQMAGQRLMKFDARLERPPRGVILAVVELVDCVDMTPFWVESQTEKERELGGFLPGRHAWLLRNVQELAKPIPYKGGQGLRRFPAEVRERILEVLGRAV